MSIIDFFRPGWRHPSPTTRLKAIELLTHQKTLAMIATTDESSAVRALALKKLTDETLMAEVARHTPWPEVGLAAVERLTDQKLTAEVAEKASLASVREAGARRVRRHEARTTTDAGRLAEFAKTDPDAIVRRLAVKNSHLSDQAVLVDIATRDQDCWVRARAAERLEDQRELARIASSDPDSTVWESAIGKLHDQDLLFQVVASAKPDQSPYEDAPTCALKKISDQSLLHKLALSHSRMKALDMITDALLLADLARAASDKRVRQGAVRRIEDQNLLFEIAKQDPEESVRDEAVARITDDASLAHIAMTDLDQGVRCTAVDRLDAQDLLAELAKRDPDSEIRDRAVRRITDPALVADLARSYPDPDIRAWLIERRIDDREVLAHLVHTDPDSMLRLVAQKKLEEIEMRSKGFCRCSLCDAWISWDQRDNKGRCWGCSGAS